MLIAGAPPPPATALLALARPLLHLLARIVFVGLLLAILIDVGFIAPDPSGPRATLDLARRGVAAYQIARDILAPSTALPSGWVIVAHTGGEGATLRAAPRLAGRLGAWADGTRLEVVGPDAVGDGYRWRRVRAPDGQLGWIAADFLAPIPPR